MRWQRIVLFGVPVLAAAYLLLLIPPATPAAPPAGDRQPFAWNRDGYWRSLEARFQAARSGGSASAKVRAGEGVARCRDLVKRISVGAPVFTDPVFDAVEKGMFELAPDIAACPALLPDYVRLQSDLRNAVKAQSRHWDAASPAVRDRLYRLLYGSRAAVEEAILQSPRGACPPLAPGVDEPSQTPAVEVAGVVVHSGDILVSRGGAPASALIARGSDHPGNFSHVALVHVDAETKQASIIEAHIQRGVAVSTVDEYLRDKKLRILVLRPRAGLPALAADPQLPHKAACWALEGCRNRHVPYDFAMDCGDHDRLFCSEVAAAAYEKFGITLWPGVSPISAPGVRAWLAAFGVRHFETLEPADLEYDPQVSVVAEWRDPEALFQDHADNAAVDAMLEAAERGAQLEYSLWTLPFARAAKGFSVTLNLFGLTGPVPEGMDAAGALRHARFNRTHARIRAQVVAAAEVFRRENGRLPPYWELVRLARRAVGVEDGVSRPAFPRGGGTAGR